MSQTLPLLCHSAAGEIGSRLDAAAEVEYYNAVADYANLRHDASTGSEQQPLQGWIWAGYSNGGLGHLRLVISGRLAVC